MEIGFTGSRHGVSLAQQGKLHALLMAYWMPGNRLHHGDCTGGDEVAFNCGKLIGYGTIAYPATNVSDRWKANTGSDERVEGYESLPRNDLIVQNSWLLIATPLSKPDASSLRGGTWYTIRKARKANHPTWVIMPDGRAEFWPPEDIQKALKVDSFNWSDA